MHRCLLFNFLLSSVLAASTFACVTTKEYSIQSAARQGLAYDCTQDTFVKEFLDRHGRVDFKVYELNGKRLFIEDIDYEKDGKYRVMRKAGHFKDEQGPAYGYYPDGKIWIRTTLKDEKRHGPFFSYYNNGQIESEATYYEGKPDKTMRLFWENGQLYGVLTYDKGSLKSVDGFFDKTGKPLPKGSFVNGNGELWRYDDAGEKVERIEIYKDGRKTKTKTAK